MHTILPGLPNDVAESAAARGCEACFDVVDWGMNYVFAGSDTLLGHPVEVTQLPCNLGPWQHQPPRRWKSAHQFCAVVLRDHPRIGDDDSTAITGSPDQAPESLFQPQCCMRHHEFGKGIAAPLDDRFTVGCGYRLGRDAEWQPRNQQPPERVT